METLTVARIEFRRLAVRPMVWWLTAATLAWLAWNFIIGLSGFLKLEPRLAALPGAPGFTDLVAVPLLAQFAQIALLLAPLLAMSSLAGERRNGTLSMLFAAGTGASGIVLGKYLALLTWMGIMLLLVLAMPLSLAPATALDWGKLAAASLGIALLLATLLALAVACSAATAQPALAATGALILSLLLWAGSLAGSDLATASPVLHYLTLPTHLRPLLRGWVDTRDLVYFLLLIGLALSFAVHRLGNERKLG
ncbi:MAG TPA: ABC transporter permease [Mizugakiibacter sp.]|mgnify:CR=1 FL=1|nr:ABC transporter permease [Mizugakiibacter sp.]